MKSGRVPPEDGFTSASMAAREVWIRRGGQPLPASLSTSTFNASRKEKF
jgi:hypothetical protein